MDKLQLTVPVTLLDLFQQLGDLDVMQFEANSWTGGRLSVVLQRQGGHVTISIDGIGTAVAETVEDRWCCGMKTITSHVLLTTGGVSPAADRPTDPTSVIDTALPSGSNANGEECVDARHPLPSQTITPSTCDVLQLAACQTIPLESTMNQTQLQLICSGITDGIDEAGRDANIVDALSNDAWRSLLDTTGINQPAEQPVSPSDGETVVNMLTGMGPGVEPKPPAEPGRGLVQCNICSNSYQLFGSLYKHVREVHHADPRYSDALKHIQYIRFRRLKRKSALVLDCWVCGEQCFGHQLFKHITVVHGERDDVADLMDKAKKLYGREARSVYKRCAPANVRAQCAHCHRNFAKKYVKKHEAHCRHVDATVSVARLQCDICSKQFVSRKAIYEHRRRVHRMLAGARLMQPHKCEVCGREFSVRAKLRYHMVTHTGERNHRCEVCGRAFKDAYTMRHHHKTVHLGQYRFHCPKCGRNFDKLRRLKEHRCSPKQDYVVKTENPTVKPSEGQASGSLSTDGNDVRGGSGSCTGDVTTCTKSGAVCDLCGRTYRDKMALQDHHRVVHGIYLTKPTPKFTCHFCEKNFARRAKLKAHLQTHSDERRYVCEVCQRAFKDPYTMKHHHQTQHLHKYRFQCDVCGRAFDKQRHLQRHKCNPAVMKSFCYRNTPPMKTCSTTLTPVRRDTENTKDTGKTKDSCPAKNSGKAKYREKAKYSGKAKDTVKAKNGGKARKRCRKLNVEGVRRRTSVPSDNAVAASSDKCDGKTTPMKLECNSESKPRMKRIGDSSAVDEDTKVVAGTDERHPNPDNAHEQSTVMIPSQLTPDTFGSRSGQFTNDHRATDEFHGTDTQKTNDNIEEIRSGVVAECFQSASDDQRVVLAYQVTASSRASGEGRVDEVTPSSVSQGVDVGGQHPVSTNKTPGCILVTFMPAAMVKQQKHSQTLQQCDKVSSPQTTRHDTNNEAVLKRTLSDSQEAYEGVQSGQTGNKIWNSPALGRRSNVTLTEKNGPMETITSRGTTRVVKSGCCVEGTAEPTRQRRSVRQEQRRMLKVRQTQIV